MSASHFYSSSHLTLVVLLNPSQPTLAGALAEASLSTTQILETNDPTRLLCGGQRAPGDLRPGSGIFLMTVMGWPPLLLGRINVLILQVASHLLASF